MCALHPPFHGVCRGDVTEPKYRVGVLGALVRPVSMVTQSVPSYFTGTRHDEIMANGLSFKKSCPILNKTGIIC